MENIFLSFTFNIDYLFPNHITRFNTKLHINCINMVKYSCVFEQVKVKETLTH